jgi:hypothetical protein
MIFLFEPCFKNARYQKLLYHENSAMLGGLPEICGARISGFAIGYWMDVTTLEVGRFKSHHLSRGADSSCNAQDFE